MVHSPAIVLSFILTAVACGFAALCYAEFAAMVPISGSAYTYSYATLGELVAWIIGWDLVLEYAVGAATVANGWSSFFQTLLPRIGIHLPEAISRLEQRGARREPRAQGRQAAARLRSRCWCEGQ